MLACDNQLSYERLSRRQSIFFVWPRIGLSQGRELSYTDISTSYNLTSVSKTTANEYSRQKPTINYRFTGLVE